MEVNDQVNVNNVAVVPPVFKMEEPKSIPGIYENVLIDKYLVVESLLSLEADKTCEVCHEQEESGRRAFRCHQCKAMYHIACFRKQNPNAPQDAKIWLCPDCEAVCFIPVKLCGLTIVVV